MRRSSCRPSTSRPRLFPPIQQLTDAVIPMGRQVYDVFHYLRQYCPGYASAYLLDTATALGVRESRRIMGEYVLTYEDVKNARTFPDGIARGAYAIDVHEATGEIFHDHVRDGIGGTSPNSSTYSPGASE